MRTHGHPYHRCWGRCQALVPSALQGMRAQGHTTLALAHARDPQADDGAQRPGRQPCGLREPHGGAGRRGLAPTSTRCSGGLLVLRGLEQGCIHAPRRGACRGAACPPVVLRGMTQARDLADHAGARGGGLRLRGPSSTRPTRTGVLGWEGTGQRGRRDAWRRQETPPSPGHRHHACRVWTPEDRLDPAEDGQLASRSGRHDCSLLQSGENVIGTVYDDRILVSSGQWWPFPRGATLVLRWPSRRGRPLAPISARISCKA